MSTYTYSYNKVRSVMRFYMDWTWRYSEVANPSGCDINPEFKTTIKAMIDNTVTLPEYITHEDSRITKVELSITFEADSDNVADFGVVVRIPTTKFLGSGLELWNICETGMEVGGFVVPSGETRTASITLTNPEIVENFMRNGYCVNPTSYADSESRVSRIKYKKTVVTLEYESMILPPNVTITKPISVESVSITDDIEISWRYEQSANVIPIKYEIYYNTTDSSDWKIWDTILYDTDNSVLDTSILKWNVNSDNLTVKLKVRAYTYATIYGESEAIQVKLWAVKCANLSPTNGIIRLNSEVIQLKWSVGCVSGAPSGLIIKNQPSEYQIQYSVNSGEDWKVISDKAVIAAVDGVYRFDIPENTFENGIITWRVRPWINGYVIENYEKGVFVARVQASTSSVYCDGKPQPTLSWQSTAQVAYQVRFDEYDSGAVYGTEQSFTIPYFYTDGVYRVQIRTQASSGVWSPWTEPEYVTISNIAEHGEISLSVNPTRHAVAIEWNSERGFVGYILYRNGVPVYSGGERSFTDIGANGTAEYCVRGIADTGYYAISETVTVDATPKTDCIYDMDNQIWIPLKYSQAPRTRGYGRTAQVHYNYYAGRRNPVAFTEGNIDTTVNVSYLLKTREEAERILKLAGKMVLYKDTNGGVLIGIVTDPGYQSERFYPVSFTITGVDYNEAVKYEAVSG